MDAIRLPQALLGVAGFVAVTPVWVYFVQAYSGPLGYEATFLTGLTLPAAAILFLASWLQPR